VTLLNGPFFNEFTLDLGREARPVVRKLAEKGVLGGVSLGRLWPGEKSLQTGMIVAVTETATDEDFDAYEDALDEVMA
jgi:glycine dehydrogenase subunit 1